MKPKSLKTEDVFLILLAALAMREPTGRLEVSPQEMDTIIEQNIIVTVDHDRGEEPYVIQAVAPKVN